MSTPFDFVEADHFRALTDETAARELFRRSVQMVEIEIFSYCNRVCWFCPNASGDRRGDNQFMAAGLYAAILRQLAAIDYAGVVTYSRYNEPLADRIILDRLREARAALPNARLHTNTNGDYLDAALLDELCEAGLNNLGIQVYLGNREHYDHERMRRAMQKLCRRAGIEPDIVRDEPGVWLEGTTTHRGMGIRVYARNFDLNGTSRGDTVPIRREYARTSPCLSPFWHFYVDFNGKVMPCCNLRSDIPAHADAAVGQLEEGNSLFLIYAGQALSAWRRSLVGYGEKGGLCRSCTFVTYEPGAENLAANERLERLVDSVTKPVIGEGR